MATPQDSSSSRDWAAQLTGKLEWVVGLIRDHSLRPATNAVRAIVVGVIAGLVALVVVVGSTVGLIRLFDEDVFRGRVWATDFAFGGILIAAGGVLLRASARTRRHDAAR